MEMPGSRVERTWVSSGPGGLPASARASRAWCRGLSLGVEALGSSFLKNKMGACFLGLRPSPPTVSPRRPGQPPLEGFFLLAHFLPALVMVIGFLGKR